MKNDVTSNKPAPLGFEWYLNPVTCNWVLRPCVGYSKKYLTETTFVPEKPENENVSFDNNKGKSVKLLRAKKCKNDEFYTSLEDITNELKHYKGYFEGKIVYCPCDKVFNLGRSNFVEYFISKFHKLGIKKLICTQYNPNGLGVVNEIDFSKCGIKWVYNGEEPDDIFVDESKVDTYFLKGNGSFDSEECKEIMRACDVVVTNPPFSLFRAFLAQIMELGKQFIIVGNMNAISYKEVFPYIQNNEIWSGYGFNITCIYKTPYKNKVGNNTKHVTSKGYDPNDGYIAVPAIVWYTNIEHQKRKEELYLGKRYKDNPTSYPKYDEYDAIEVSRVEDIPKDYAGVMGVPISFLGKYCPTQFEIIGLDRYVEDNPHYGHRFTIDGKEKYARILIRNLHPEK